MRPIDADALSDAMYDNEFQTFCPLDEVSGVIAVAPTLDCAPVVHGEWLFDASTAQYGNPYRCPLCKEETNDTHNYCPNCGAKMDGGEENARK